MGISEDLQNFAVCLIVPPKYADNAECLEKEHCKYVEALAEKGFPASDAESFACKSPEI